MAPKTIYVVGSGDTLRGFDFEKLRGGEIITVNDNYQWMPFAQHLVILDKPFYTAHKQRLQQFKGKIYNDSEIPRCIPIPTTPLNNSGYSALMLALSMHPKTIHLLGFDMCRIKFNRHFDQEPEPCFTNFKDCAAEINKIKTRIKIYNYSEISIITAFPKRPLSDLPLPESNKNTLTII